MSNFYNLDVAADCVKSIVDSTRCAICDRIDEARSRYACGHTACANCVVTAQSCLACLTPPKHDEVSVDEPLTRRAKQAAELLSAFQNTFHLDVLRRQRISEQLKLEKELFPQCIQSPVTYYNKRRSSKSIKGIGNHYILPGEIIEPPRMDKSKNFVQEWLEKNENNHNKYQPRSPLSDLKVNGPRCSNKSAIKKRADIILDKVRYSENQTSHTKSRKRSFKTALTATKSQSRLDKYLKSTEKGNSSGTRRNATEVKKEFEQHEKTACQSKSENDESGIVMEDDLIVIEDSQSQAVDKDRQAWLAVLKACENEGERSSQETVTTLHQYPAVVKTFSLKELGRQNDTVRSKNDVLNRNTKVPFYKRSSLVPLMNYCNENKSAKDPVQYKANDVSITVETHALVTTIQVSRCKKPILATKISKSVQTDEEAAFLNNNKKHVATEMHESEVQIKSKYDLNSVDLFKSQEIFTEHPAIKHKVIDTHGTEENTCVIESGSDSEQEHSCSLVVTADVHPLRKSDNVQRGILTEIHAASNTVKRPPKRGYSPTSSNSSDKENHDPNARKKPGIDKKRKKRKL